MLLPTVVNVLLSLVPTVVTAPTMTAAIRAAIIPYSSAVTARLSALRETGDGFRCHGIVARKPCRLVNKGGSISSG